MYTAPIPTFFAEILCVERLTVAHANKMSSHLRHYSTADPVHKLMRVSAEARTKEEHHECRERPACSAVSARIDRKVTCSLLL
jgi:hypothetical protein